MDIEKFKAILVVFADLNRVAIQALQDASGPDGAWDVANNCNRGFTHVV